MIPAPWRPARYPNGGTLSKRDVAPIAVMGAVCLAAYVAHDVFQALPLPSEETLGFIGFVAGLFSGRALKP